MCCRRHFPFNNKVLGTKKIEPELEAAFPDIISVLRCGRHCANSEKTQGSVDLAAPRSTSKWRAGSGA